MQANLIYDVGLHNGADTAYYLHKGFRVLAIEANPILTAAAQVRFKKEIALGLLTVLNIGVADREGTLSFWVNDANDTQSSFDLARATSHGLCHEVRVSSYPLSAVTKEYGVPYYLKSDIQGNDFLCIKTLDPSDLPKYISVELDSPQTTGQSNDEHNLIADLQAIGYRRFKIINQTTFTDSTPIFDNQVALRLLRKASSRLPGVKCLINALPVSTHLKKTDFDNFLDQFDRKFEGGCSGPFGEETWGPWCSFEEIKRRVRTIERELKVGHNPPGTFWFDVHATY
jgi:FkbM family methyltransferase